MAGASDRESPAGSLSGSAVSEVLSSTTDESIGAGSTSALASSDVAERSSDDDVGPMAMNAPTTNKMAQAPVAANAIQRGAPDAPVTCSGVTSWDEVRCCSLMTVQEIVETSDFQKGARNSTRTGEFPGQSDPFREFSEAGAVARPVEREAIRAGRTPIDTAVDAADSDRPPPAAQLDDHERSRGDGELRNPIPTPPDRATYEELTPLIAGTTSNKSPMTA